MPSADAHPPSEGGVAVVTDSTAYLPDDLVKKHAIQVVPLDVVIDGKAYDELTEADARTVADALRRRSVVTTSRPAPQAFASAYEAAAARGSTGIVSVHLSADMSGTVEAAQIAAAGCPIPVAVVDSRVLGLALGFAAIAAAEAAERGATVADAAAAARDRAARTSSFFYVDTLEYLRRGGRIGTARALLGSALAVKPLLNIVDGRIDLLEKVRTSTKAILRLEELAVKAAGSDPVDIAVHHLSATGRAQALASRLRTAVPRVEYIHVREVGGVVGAHVGPGMLGVMVAPR